jgi:hypothetical protein
MHLPPAPENWGFGDRTDSQLLILASARMRKAQTTAVGQK